MNAQAPHGCVCRDCKWFDRNLCHRFPPQITLWPTDNQHPIIYNPCETRPGVKPDDWCGEWQAEDRTRS